MLESSLEFEVFDFPGIVNIVARSETEAIPANAKFRFAAYATVDAMNGPIAFPTCLPDINMPIERPLCALLLPLSPKSDAGAAE